MNHNWKLLIVFVCSFSIFIFKYSFVIINKTVNLMLASLEMYACCFKLKQNKQICLKFNENNFLILVFKVFLNMPYDLTDFTKGQLVAYRNSGFSYGEISDIVNLPRSTISSYLLRYNRDRRINVRRER